jgi:hypothetical protein
LRAIFYGDRGSIPDSCISILSFRLPGKTLTLFIEIIMFQISFIDFLYSFLGLQLELTIFLGFTVMKHFQSVFLLLIAARTVLGQAERDAAKIQASGKNVGIQPSKYQA